MITTCGICGSEFEKSLRAINVAKARGFRQICSAECRDRSAKETRRQNSKRKAEYDRAYRALNGEQIKAKKRADYYADHEASLLRSKEQRQRRMPKHVEYCRRPEYRQYKKEYDRTREAKKHGPFADAYLLLLDVQKEIRRQASRYEVYKAKGYFQRSAIQRRRELWRMMQMNLVRAT